jgi:2-polyprenyl-6-methoxyphenol hydroxylase-like FAD-dependent oxidoreductase
VGIRTYELFYTNRFGQEIWRELRGTDAGYELPQFSIHRGRLQAVIHQAVRARIGESRIHTGHHLGSFHQDEGGVTAYFFDRHGAHRATARGDVLVGADGIHSLAATRFIPTKVRRWNGAMLSRRGRMAELPHRPLDGDRRRHGRQARDLPDRRGGAVGPPPHQLGGGRQDRRRLDSTAEQGRLVAGRPLRELMPHVQRFRIPYVNAQALIEATPEFWEYPMCDRDPLPRWSHGRITLLGDAAHPMYPVGSNGASQAILDARCPPTGCAAPSMWRTRSGSTSKSVCR